MTTNSTDPVSRDQSKYRDAAGTLRYGADGSEVYPGPSGVRRWPVFSEGDRARWTHDDRTHHGLVLEGGEHPGAVLVLPEREGAAGWVHVDRLVLVRRA